MRLDKKDWAILYELDFEARQSNKQIGRKVGLSPETVHYRIKQLEKDNIIQRYMIILRFTLLGIKQHKIYFQFHHFTHEAEKEIVSFCVGHPQIIWVASCVGTYDLLIAILTKTTDAFLVLKNEILFRFARYIVNHHVTHMVESVTYRRNYFIGQNNHFPAEVILDRTDDKEIAVDNIDITILQQLAKNGRMPAVEIARNIHSTPRQVLYRIRALEKSGVIHGCKLSINYQKLDISFFKCFIKLENPTPARLKQFVSYCRLNPHIIHHVRTLGDWDLEPEFEVFGPTKFYALLREMRHLFVDIIHSLDTIMITDEHKFAYFPEK